MNPFGTEQSSTVLIGVPRGLWEEVVTIVEPRGRGLGNTMFFLIL